MAEMLWALTAATARTTDFPRYPDMIENTHKPRDNRTAEEIRDNLVARLRGGIA